MAAISRTPRLDALLKRVRAATRARGATAQLARDLGQPPQAITNWLGKCGRKPSGEHALALLDWLKKRSR
jgi:hypothetical protein